ncbi:MAG: ATP synthase subunit I [Nitrospirae bacterium]|nr:ATP synthase subunit I [Nitrospirota bacterium]
MTDKNDLREHSAKAVAAGVPRKTAVLAGIGIAAVVAVQMTAWPGYPLWPVPVGVVFGAVLGLINFRWLAYTVERVYLRKGTSSILANLAAAAINVLKLSVIFIVLFVVIKNQWVHLVGLVIGLTLSFGAILWQGYGLVAGLKEQQERTGGER